jgi:hypothetical protein
MVVDQTTVERVENELFRSKIIIIEHIVFEIWKLLIRNNIDNYNIIQRDKR